MKSLALIALIVFIRFDGYGQLCQCDVGEKEINFKDVVTICGTVDSNAQGDTTLLSEISIKDWKSDKILYRSFDGSETYRVNKFPDSAVIIQFQLLPDSSMRQLTLVPLSSAVLKIGQNGEPYISPFNFVFKMPKMTEYQKRYLDTLCRKLKARIMHPKVFYPFDETSIYALFLGTLTKYNDCYKIFVNLDKYFTLDGGIAETKDEIPLEYITKNMRNSFKK